MIFVYFVGHRHLNTSVDQTIYVIRRRILKKTEEIKKIDIHQKKNLNQNIRKEEGKVYYLLLLNNL